jgi:uncharacterized integral membrane protein (TIGR00698 family)
LVLFRLCFCGYFNLMQLNCPHFRNGVILTAFLAVLALGLAHAPGASHLGVLTLALLLGLGVRACLHVPERHHLGIGFSAKQLLRVGIVLLGVRLNFALLAHAGPRIFVLDATVIVVGLVMITRLGKWFGLKGVLPLLMAVDSSICGASAVAALAPVLRARNEDMALVIPIGSLIGTAGVLGLTLAQHTLNLPPTTFGILAGSTLHEVAQVMAASAAVPNALEPGAVTKLLRVVMLAPVLLVLGLLAQRKAGAAAGKMGLLTQLASLWFVGGFLLVGAINTALFQLLPADAKLLTGANQQILVLSTFLMAMAMAGLGLQIDFGRLKANGLRTAATGLIGWLLLFAMAAAETHFLRL